LRGCLTVGENSVSSLTVLSGKGIIRALLPMWSRSTRILFGVVLAILCPQLVFAQLGIGLTASAPGTVALGNNIHYTITVNNQTGLPLTSVDVINDFPISLQFVGAQSNRGPVSVSSGRVTMTITQLNTGDPAQLFLDLRPTATGTVANAISVSRSGQTVATNTTTTTVTGGAPGGGDLSISIAPPPSTPTIFVDDWVAYTISLSKGGGAVSGVLVSSPLPARTIFRGASAGGSLSGSNVVFNLGTISSQVSTQLFVTIQPLVATNYVLSARVSASGDTNTSNNFATNSGFTAIPPVSGQLQASIASAQQFNPQTALIEQRIQVTNTTGTSTVASARVILTNFGYRVYNAVGTNDGHPFVVHGGSLQSTQAVELLLEYLIPDRTPKNNPDLIAYSAGTVNLSASEGSPTPITNIVIRPPSGAMTDSNLMLQFPSTLGATYQILYSSNSTFSPAFKAEPPVKAPANWVQWIDYGPPKTLSRPVFEVTYTTNMTTNIVGTNIIIAPNIITNPNMRFYRVMKLP
jgi:hypothetical protein